MKKILIGEIVLTCILGITGWYLFNVMKQVELNSPGQKTIEGNNALVFSEGVGIDVVGNRVDSILVNKTDKIERFVAAFLLRCDSLDADLKFWNDVNSYLSKSDIIRLTAYCENEQCIETVRKNLDTIHITVLEYGGVIDMQSIISVDAVGEFWLRGNKIRRIKWRDNNLTPFDIAKNIGLEQ